MEIFEKKVLKNGKLENGDLVADLQDLELGLNTTQDLVIRISKNRIYKKPILSVPTSIKILAMVLSWVK